jgi:hypothetical protein
VFFSCRYRKLCGTVETWPQTSFLQSQLNPVYMRTELDVTVMVLSLVNRETAKYEDVLDNFCPSAHCLWCHWCFRVFSLWIHITLFTNTDLDLTWQNSEIWNYILFFVLLHSFIQNKFHDESCHIIFDAQSRLWIAYFLGSFRISLLNQDIPIVHACLSWRIISVKWRGRIACLGRCLSQNPR